MPEVYEFLSTDPLTLSPRRARNSARPPVKWFVGLALCLLAVACFGSDISSRAGSNPRPNILLILADDLGFSDLGAFGAEINTPNLDALARSGLRMTNMHVNATCSPTRAMLLSGVDSHVAGMGTMAGDATEGQKGQPGYEMHLNFRVVTFARLLRDAGYHTYVTGKWDLGGRGRPELWPVQRGFEESFVLIEGSADHYEDLGAMQEIADPTYVENDKEVELPEDFYSSKTYADKLIEFIRGHAHDDRPFFGYLAFTAPHYPVQTPDEFIERYAGVYEVGYDAIRAARLQRQRDSGLIPAALEPAPPSPQWPAWDTLSNEVKVLEVRRMQAYAGMVEAMDHHIGRVLQHLRRSGEFEDTLIIFLSDNGPEGGNPLDWGWAEFAAATRDQSAKNIGRRNSYAWPGPGWAHVSAAPWRLFKGFAHSGGLISPTIVHYPDHIAAATISSVFATVLDFAPTFMELAHADYPSDYQGRALPPLAGESMVDHLFGNDGQIHGPDYVVGMEIFNRRALFKRGWKIVYANAPWGTDDWELYNLAEDATEQRNLATSRPDKLQEMLQAWEHYVRRNGVILAPDFYMPWTNTASHYKWQPAQAF